MTTRITATHAVRTFSDLLNRMRYRGEEFVVERGGEEICRMTPVRPSHLTFRQFADLLRELPSPDSGFAADVRAVARSQPRSPRSPWER